MRYTDETKDYNQVHLDCGIANPLGVPPGHVINDCNSLSSGMASESFNNVTYNVSLSHRFSDEFMLYGYYATGFKSGGFTGRTVAFIALLGFSTAARKLAPRDRFIGWTTPLREKNLPLVVDNARFLILPWITIPNLGSHILAIVRRRLPEDWTERYRSTPMLIETFVETPRYTGAVYRASGWIPIGSTQGRGRYDRYNKYDKPKKDIWLRSLRKDWKRILNR